LKESEKKKVTGMGLREKELVNIRLDALDENGNEKKYVTIKDIMAAIGRTYDIDIDNAIYKDNLYRIVQRTLIGKDAKEKNQKGYIVADNKEYKIAVDYARSVLCSAKFVKSIYKLTVSGSAKTKPPRQIKYLDGEAKRNNKKYQAYIQSGQNIADAEQTRLEDETGMQAVIAKGIEDRKKDIIIGYSMEQLMDSPELKEEFQKSNEGAIDDAIREKIFEIVVKYILENYIELNEDLLENDVITAYVADLKPGELDCVDVAAIQRLQNLKNYYKERDNGEKR